MSIAELLPTKATTTLVATNGDIAGKSFTLSTTKVIIGRHPDCNVVLDIGAVSRNHAQIICVGNDYYLEDLKSRNGTLLNDQAITERKLLADGDKIRVCDIELIFHQALPPSSKKTVSPDGTVSNYGMGVVLDEDMGSQSDIRGSVMSRVGISSSSVGFRVSANAEAKLHAVLEIAQNLGLTLSLDAMFPKLLDSLFKIFVQADRGVVALKTKEGDIVPRAVKQRHNKSEEETIRLSRTIVNQVLESKQAILSEDASTDSRFEMSQSITDFRIRSMMCVPLLDGNDEALGLIQIDSMDQRNRFQQEDLDVLMGVAIQASFAIDNINLHENLVRQHQIERDLELAHKVQQALLPSKPPNIANYHFFDFYDPAYQVGGDFYDYIPLPNGRLAVVLADVSGKGVSAALVMAKLSADVRYSLALEPEIDLAMNKINADFCRNGWEDRFVTLVLVVLDHRHHEITIVNAGHMPPFLRESGKSVVSLFSEEAGIPLGVAADWEYKACTRKLEPNQFVAIFTDGFSEAMNVQRELYTLERLRKQIGNSNQDVAELGRSILSDVQSFVSGHPQSDDMCLICLGRTL